MSRMLLLPLLVLFVGCATYTGQDLDPDKALIKYSTTSFDWPDEGRPLFVMAAHLPEDGQHAEQYFGVNLLDYDVLPVEIYLKNNSKDSKFQLAAAKLTFRIPALPDGEGLEMMEPDEVQALAGFSQWRSFWAYLLVIIPGPFSNMDIAAANKEMREDYRDKAFEAVGLSPQDQAAYVVFMRPTGELSLEELMPDLKTGSLEAIVTCIPGRSDDERELKTEFTAKVNFQ